MEKVEGGRRGYRGKGGDMIEYFIVFNDKWVFDYIEDELREKSRVLRSLLVEMKVVGVFIFTGGLDFDVFVFSVDVLSGMLLFIDGLFVEFKEYLGGFVVVDVVDEEVAWFWVGKIVVVCGWL